MRLKTVFPAILLSMLVVACGSEDDSNSVDDPPSNGTVQDEPTNDGKGIGETTSVELNDPLDQNMVAHGKEIYELKCAACHKLTSQRVVGPGWAGITERRKPEWIMNMTTNVDVMLEEDPVAQELLKECLTRMPNQNVSVSDARDILEFMYQNDEDRVQ